MKRLSGFNNEDNKSIHLENYPEANIDVINQELERQVKIAKNIIELLEMFVEFEFTK
ncbi:MAG: hypothetical protein Ct9H90mP17_2820 [Actinomycetota bacterium]|nr:MAG: hypothetical protein Ct9H90mP17_2820 [Actinomycetota bacterium]